MSGSVFERRCALDSEDMKHKQLAMSDVFAGGHLVYDMWACRQNDCRLCEQPSIRLSGSIRRDQRTFILTCVVGQLRTASEKERVADMRGCDCIEVAPIDTGQDVSRSRDVAGTCCDVRDCM